MDEQNKKDRKRAYNRNNYAKNRTKRCTKAQQRYYQKKVIKFPTPTETISLTQLAPNRSKKTLELVRWGVGEGWVTIRFLEQIIILGIILLSTYFLLTESVKFLNMTEGSTPTAWLKAVIVEVLILVLSWIKVSGLKNQTARTVLLLALFAYTGWSVVGGVWMEGQTKTLEASLPKQKIVELERTIAQKEAMRDRYVTQGSDTLARRYDRQIDSLREQLDAVRIEMLKNPEAEMVLANFSALAIFRLLVMFANSFLVSYFSAFFSTKPAARARLVPC